MPTNEEFEQAEENVDRWLKGRLEGQSYMAEQLCPLVEQLCRDLNEAHNEILRQQGVPESDWGKFDWPEWTNQANSIRWAEDILKAKMAKTDNWTRYPGNAAATPSTEAQKCVKCGHYKFRSKETGYCREVLNWYDDTYCGCQCAFPAEAQPDDPEKQARERLAVFVHDDSYSLIAQHRSDTSRDRDITGDVEAVCALRARPVEPLFTEGNRAEAIRLLRELRETGDAEEAQRQKESWGQLEAALCFKPVEQESLRLLTDCRSVIVSLADQQAMPDKFYEKTLVEVDNFLRATEK